MWGSETAYTLGSYPRDIRFNSCSPQPVLEYKMTDEDAKKWNVPTDKEHEAFMRANRRKMLFAISLFIVTMVAMIMMQGCGYLIDKKLGNELPKPNQLRYWIP